MGRRLVALVLERARTLRLERVTATMLAENTPMRHLLVEAGYPILADRIDAGVEEIVLDPGAACAVCCRLSCAYPSAASATKSIAEMTPIGRPWSSTATSR